VIGVIAAIQSSGPGAERHLQDNLFGLAEKVTGLTRLG
jgi:hypothetical protein